jgi:hypothetical protein
LSRCGHLSVLIANLSRDYFIVQSARERSKKKYEGSVIAAGMKHDVESAQANREADHHQKYAQYRDAGRRVLTSTRFGSRLGSDAQLIRHSSY